ncbi:MAG: hypothetical protein ABW032_01800 [Burkholderiaceae bacterium]
MFKEIEALPAHLGAVPDRPRGPALATRADSAAEVAAALERQLAQCRRRRSVLGLVCIAIEAIEGAAEREGVGADLERRATDEVVHRICGHVRGGDLVLCSDDRHACVILPGAGDQAVRRIAARFLRALNGLYRIDEALLNVTVRVGSASHPQDGSMAQELLQRATER